MLLSRMNPFVSYLPDISQYYGVEPLERLEIPEREEEDIPELDFRSMVVKKNNEKHRKQMQEEEERRETLRNAEKRLKDAKIEKEQELRKEVDKVIEEFYKYHNSVLGILDNIQADYSNLNLEATEIHNKLADPDNMAFLKDVLTKLG